MYIWIRHAQKEYSNGKGPKGSKQHDSPILSNFNTVLDIEDVTKNIIDNHDLPDMIITSPFLRTRQTSKYMADYIEENFKKKVDICIDQDIHEYLGFYRPKLDEEYPDITNETNDLLTKRITFGESQNELLLRVTKHLQRTLQIKDKKIWIVTHGIVMSKIYDFLYNNKVYRPLTLDYFVYK